MGAGMTETPTPRLRFKPRTTIHRSAFPDRWIVPPHLRGLACQACGHFFQDGESHGELDLTTGEITCTWRLVRFHRQPMDWRAELPAHD